MDCNGEWGGEARVDENCGICIEGTTDLKPCNIDCSGYCGENDLCIGGSNEGGDCSDNGDNDCPGIWGGNYTTDLCGICDADSENDNQCVDCNDTVDGLAKIDNCGYCVEDLSIMTGHSINS